MNTNKSKNINITGGFFVISIDYELNWGVLDRKNNESYHENIISGRKEFLKVIDLLKKYNVQATIAIVGLLLNRSKNEILENIPDHIPNYSFKNSTPFKGQIDKIGNSENDDLLHFGSSIIDQIKSHENLEVATHTYGHYYCLDKGHSPSSFDSDIEMTLKLSKKNNIDIKSIIFPRNQINENYLRLCYDKGITSYRGNEKSWIYRDGFKRNINPLVRMLRIIDAYVNITGHNTHPIPEKIDALINIPSSSFFRPIRHWNSFSSSLKVKRIKKAMEYAAKNNEIYHLWWHPHNFGRNEKAIFNELKQVIDHYNLLNKKYGMTSKSMNQISDIVRERKS